MCGIKITHSKMVEHFLKLLSKLDTFTLFMDKKLFRASGIENNTRIPEISGKSGYGSSGMFLPGGYPNEGLLVMGNLDSERN